MYKTALMESAGVLPYWRMRPLRIASLATSAVVIGLRVALRTAIAASR